MKTPRVILLISGKRKSGKDFISENIKTRLHDKCCIVRISEPIKSTYASKHNLDLKEMMSDGPYKETHRLDMIKWSEEVREHDPGFFCKTACLNAPEKDVWIVSDVRRQTDVNWFKETYTNIVKTIRIETDLDVRKQRGYIYTDGVDNVASECGLDDYKCWDLTVTNNDEESCVQALEDIVHLIQSLLIQ